MTQQDLIILKELKTYLVSNLGSQIQEVILFGSRLGKKATKISDFDVLIIIDKTVNWQLKRNIRDLCYDIGFNYDIIFDTKIISSNTLKNSPFGKHPLYQDALKYGKYA